MGGLRGPSAVPRLTLKSLPLRSTPRTKGNTPVASMAALGCWERRAGCRRGGAGRGARGGERGAGGAGSALAPPLSPPLPSSQFRTRPRPARGAQGLEEHGAPVPRSAFSARGSVPLAGRRPGPRWFGPRLGRAGEAARGRPGPRSEPRASFREMLAWGQRPRSSASPLAGNPRVRGYVPARPPREASPGRRMAAPVGDRASVPFTGEGAADHSDQRAPLGAYPARKKLASLLAAAGSAALLL